MFRLLALLLSSALVAAPAEAQRSAPTAARPPADGFDRDLRAWLAAFNDLDLDRFLTYFSAAGTVFPPRGDPEPMGGRRVEPERLREHWSGVFAILRRGSSRTAAPFMNIEPRDLRVERLGRDAALVTFHLGEGPWTNRRTLVWRREGRGWRILHLHASRLAPPAPAPAPQ